MVGPIDVQNVILNAYAQSASTVNNPVNPALAAEAFKAALEKRENSEKTSRVNESENDVDPTINPDREHTRKRKSSLKDENEHIDLKA